MEGKYMVRKRLRGIDTEKKEVNIPYGTIIECKAGWIRYRGRVLCFEDCQMQKDYLVQANSPNPKERATAIEDILYLLRRPGNHATPKEVQAYDSRWKEIWDDPNLQKYRREDFEDYWLWNNKFYDAEYVELLYILNKIRRY